MIDFKMTYRIFTLINGVPTERERTAAIQAGTDKGATLEALQLVNDWNRAAIVTAKASGVLYHYDLISVFPFTQTEEA